MLRDSALQPVLFAPLPWSDGCSRFLLGVEGGISSQIAPGQTRSCGRQESNLRTRFTNPVLCPRMGLTQALVALRPRRGMPCPALNRDPAELRELVHWGAAAEASPPRVLHAAERHLRLVADRLVVDVHDARLDPLGEQEASVRICRDDPGREPVARRDKDSACAAETIDAEGCPSPSVGTATAARPGVPGRRFLSRDRGPRYAWA
jgi:hypothetical protein